MGMRMWVCACTSTNGLLLSETMFFVFFSGWRTACSVKSITRHNETETAGVTGADGKSSAQF